MYTHKDGGFMIFVKTVAMAVLFVVSLSVAIRIAAVVGHNMFHLFSQTPMHLF